MKLTEEAYITLHDGLDALIKGEEESPDSKSKAVIAKAERARQELEAVGTY